MLIVEPKHKTELSLKSMRELRLSKLSNSQTRIDFYLPVDTARSSYHTGPPRTRAAQPPPACLINNLPTASNSIQPKPSQF